MELLNHWHDYLRVVIIVLSGWCFYTLLKNFWDHAETWTIKTKDLWYALLAWTVVGMVQPAQGIILDRPLTPAFIVIAAAVFVTGKGLHQGGPWGDDGT